MTLKKLMFATVALLTGLVAMLLELRVSATSQPRYSEEYKLASLPPPVVDCGWLTFFAALVLFLGSIPFSLAKLPLRDQILKMGIWGVCVESIASEGGMKVFYGISGLFLFLLCLWLFQAKGHLQRHASAVPKDQHERRPRLQTALFTPLGVPSPGPISNCSGKPQ